MLGAQSIEDPLDRVALLGWGCFILFENLVDDRQHPIEFRLATRLTLPIARRLFVVENLLQRFPVQLVFFTDRSLALLLGQH